VPPVLCKWIYSFLNDRSQQVKLGQFTLDTKTISTDCTSTDLFVKLLKFADNTSVIGVILDGDAYRQQVDQLVQSEQAGAEHTQDGGDVNGF